MLRRAAEMVEWLRGVPMDYSLVPTTHVGVLKPPFTPTLGKLISSPDFYGHCTHVPHTHIDTHAHQINEEVFLKD